MNKYFTSNLSQDEIYSAIEQRVFALQIYGISGLTTGF